MSEDNKYSKWNTCNKNDYKPNICKICEILLLFYYAFL